MAVRVNPDGSVSVGREEDFPKITAEAVNTETEKSKSTKRTVKTTRK